MSNVEQSNENIEDSTLGTFKNVDALKTAYDNLRSEFTRKSQLLASFEKQKSTSDKVVSDKKENIPPSEITSLKDNLGTMHIEDKTDNNSMNTMHIEAKNNENNAILPQNNAEIEIKPFWERENWENEIRQFLKDFELSNEERKDLARILSEDKELEFSNSPLQTAYAKMLNKNKIDIDTMLQDKNFIKNRILTNKEVKDMVIQEYLKTLNEDKLSLPQFIAKPSTLGLSSKKDKSPISLADVGNLAKKYFEQ